MLPIPNEVGVVQDEVVAVEAALTTSPTLVEVEASRHPSPQKRNIYLPPIPMVESKLSMQATTLQLSISANTSKLNLPTVMTAPSP